MLPADIGTRIREIREEQGVSARALAEKADGVFSQATLSRIESGKREPKLDELLVLSWLLSAPLDEFTDDVRLKDRVTWAARSEAEVDTQSVRNDLLPFLRLRIMLDSVS
ncbi:helix-turn-helix domain-containing protein [Arcanobacterium phocae]|uniref:helix-turn-helix domain-containing protein n=1 Tax=Arcanobacterium phocae TaxID=131112 RepID=UPI001C0F0D43|nr:helix-turn-helix transcriptional regulator [Arcanobacterium phocae]